MGNAEKDFAGASRSKMWTYAIIGIVLLLGAIIVNVAFSNPELARNGVSKFFGLPSWALALVAFVVGALIYWMGLKMETDWPEFLGAFLISGSVVALEFMVGWNHFAVGGLVVLPYILPLLVFVVLVMVGMKKSV
jgi:hypothetical protein